MRTHQILVALLGTAALAVGKDVTVNVEKTPAFKLTVPDSAETKISGDKTLIRIQTLGIAVWPMKAKSVDDALPKVPEVIKDECKKFVPKTTEKLKIAGSPAKHLKGKGMEADDDDPATGEVVVFTVGKQVFAACSHWEDDAPADSGKKFLEVVKTAAPVK